MSRTTDSGESPKRSYDARNRRERAERERAETKRRVVDAAGRLFVERGYNATTMADVARESRLAMASVYKAASSKSELLHVVVELAVAGDERDVKVHERPPIAAIAEETDVVRQVERMAEFVAQIQERSAPIQLAYREAAATDPAVADSLDAALARRHESMMHVLGLVPPAALRAPLDESVDTLWAISSTEVFLLLRHTRGWSADRYLAWLTSTLVRALLNDA